TAVTQRGDPRQRRRRQPPPAGLDQASLELELLGVTEHCRRADARRANRWRICSASAGIPRQCNNTTRQASPESPALGFSESEAILVAVTPSRGAGRQNGGASPGTKEPGTGYTNFIRKKSNFRLTTQIEPERHPKW